MGFLFVLIVGLLAGTISGIVGTGSSIKLMPVLRRDGQPVPHSRLVARGRLAACAAYSIPVISAAALGARTLLSRAVNIAIAIAMVPARHWRARHDFTISLWHLVIGGALIGYITGIVVSTAP